MGRGREFLCAAALALAVAAPAAAADLVIAMPPWPSGQAAANILKLGIAKKFSLEAEVRELGTLTAFIGLEKGRSISSRRFGGRISTNSSANS